MEFTNNSLNSPKIEKLNIDTSIIPQGLSIHEKKQSSKTSCYCPFKWTTIPTHFDGLLLNFEKVTNRIIPKLRHVRKAWTLQLTLVKPLLEERNSW
jgi:hypothetical protein